MFVDIRMQHLYCMCSILDDNDDSDGFQQLLSDWTHPIQGNIESRILDIRSSNQTPGAAIRIHGTLHPYRFTKAMFDNIKVNA